MARIKSQTLVVCDAGPIIHLDEVGCLQVMKDFAKVFISYGVQQEVLKYRQVSWEDPGMSWLVVAPRFPLEKPMQTMCQIFSLDAGEVEALSILSKEPEAVFLTDDAAARLVATKLGFRVHGTIGVLVRAIRRDWMRPQEVIEALNRFPLGSTLHIKVSLLEEVISRVKREYSL